MKSYFCITIPHCKYGLLLGTNSVDFIKDFDNNPKFRFVETIESFRIYVDAESNIENKIKDLGIRKQILKKIKASL